MDLTAPTFPTIVKNDTPMTAARKVGQYLVDLYGIDPKYVFVLGVRHGGSLDGALTDMTLASHGWYVDKARGAQLVSEDADYEWVYRVADKLNTQFEKLPQEGRLFAECATGFALSITRW